MATKKTNLKISVHSPAGAAKDTIDLPAEIFDVELNIPLMHQVVTAQLAAARQGTHSVKTRGEVRGGGKKPYRQKGTGRARQGSIRTPHFVGGGVAHGPVPRDYSQRTPKKMKFAALKCALSDRARDEQIFVITEVVKGQTPSTKAASEFLNKLTAVNKILLVVQREDTVAWKSVANLQYVLPIAADQLNTYDVLDADSVVFSVAALHDFIEGAITPQGSSSTKPVSSDKAPTAAKATSSTKAKAASGTKATSTAKAATKPKSTTSTTKNPKKSASTTKKEVSA